MSIPEKIPPAGPGPYWRYTKRLTSCLLLIWALLSFTVLFFARELSNISFFGWPFSFYMAAQGLTLSFVILLATYSLGMAWIGRRQTGP
ncbi:DUF4212 domain-containing protein [Undibacterium sp. Ji50W]|uniref:DUF4212 domain-containing protein n=1 Tax=Undibacterium sp. Ji50W TaxID=3413041 RepID=UPI003BEF7958